MVCYDVFKKPPSKLTLEEMVDAIPFVALLLAEAEERASGEVSSLMRGGLV